MCTSTANILKVSVLKISKETGNHYAALFPGCTTLTCGGAAREGLVSSRYLLWLGSWNVVMLLPTFSPFLPKGQLLLQQPAHLFLNKTL